MNHAWQQPIRPLSVMPDNADFWIRVLFIRPRTERGWEALCESGNVWTDLNSSIRPVHID